MKIVKQPNGSFSVFDSEQKDLILINSNFKTLLQFYITQKAYAITKELSQVIAELNSKEDSEILEEWNNTLIEVHNEKGEHRILEIHNKIK